MSSNQSLPTRWWEGGNLHDKTIAEWLTANDQNRMATTVDMLFALRDDLGAQVDLSCGESLMAAVLQLMSCITGATQNQPDTYALKVADVALVSAQALGYLPPTAHASAADTLPT